ncbi:hypothetical protein IWQ57_000757 [Coemansia nantahalensis]|uniref:Uncharacterized protein n=2 Tax=Coemansia TaxID=4863 RepID=A0ACC1K7H2_9FUNG|nr:hypothetical protein IWQ57_000757 [Coemansia nantahalensis]
MAATERSALLAAGDLRLPPNSGRQRSAAALAEQPPGGERKLLTAWQLTALTVLLAGIQFVWTVELGYGTPYLLSLGLSKPLMTLVWMAGPLSGLIIQPVVGRLSDGCASRLGRRRPFILGGAAFVVTAVVMIAYARQIAAALAHALHVGGGSTPGGAAPGPDVPAFVTRVSIVLAVVGFYILDFSINTSQACARALALDIPPLEQQDLANAYAGRMLNLGSVTGYMVGFIDVRALLPWKTESQMQALCLVAVVVFVATITLTCVCVREVPLRVAGADGRLDARERGQAADAAAPGPRGEWADMLATIAKGVARLPTPVQRVCNVQFFAWIAWFPFLFFATTWVTEVMARTDDATDPEFLERATRAGSFALFLYSLASLGFSLLLPLFVDDADIGDGPARPSRLKISLRAMWRLSLLAMGAALLATRFVADVQAATVLIVAMAFPWAVALWAPFALVGEYVAIAAADSDADDGDVAAGSRAPATGMAGGAPAANPTPLRGESIASTVLAEDESAPSPLAHHALRLHGASKQHTASLASTSNTLPPGGGDDSTDDGEASPQAPRQKLDSGTILGIHNMYVVFPQFVINAISTLVFAWLGGSSLTTVADAPPPARSVEFLALDAVYARLTAAGGGGAGSVGVVLRIGGVSALLAAATTFFLFDRRRIRAYIADENRR